MSSSPNSLSSSSGRPHDWLMDVSCPLEVILGNATLKVADCTRLAVGSVVRLRQDAGADLHVRVAGISFAVGEVVVADDSLSIRIGRVLPPAPEALA
jgi:flagellar motor switch/type III secretory pathway protein FliN